MLFGIKFRPKLKVRERELKCLESGRITPITLSGVCEYYFTSIEETCKAVNELNLYRVGGINLTYSPFRVENENEIDKSKIVNNCEEFFEKYQNKNSSDAIKANLEK